MRSGNPTASKEYIYRTMRVSKSEGLEIFTIRSSLTKLYPITVTYSVEASWKVPTLNPFLYKSSSCPHFNLPPSPLHSPTTLILAGKEEVIIIIAASTQSDQSERCISTYSLAIIAFAMTLSLSHWVSATLDDAAPLQLMMNPYRSGK